MKKLTKKLTLEQRIEALEQQAKGLYNPPCTLPHYPCTLQHYPQCDKFGYLTVAGIKKEE